MEHWQKSRVRQEQRFEWRALWGPRWERGTG